MCEFLYELSGQQQYEYVALDEYVEQELDVCEFLYGRAEQEQYEYVFPCEYV